MWLLLYLRVRCASSCTRNRLPGKPGFINLALREMLSSAPVSGFVKGSLYYSVSLRFYLHAHPRKPLHVGASLGIERSPAVALLSALVLAIARTFPVVDDSFV